MDNLTPERRSWNMGQIKSTNTRPELAVRSRLHRLGYRFRIHRRDLPGCPDIVLPKYKSIIFVHGCYWHRHEGCRYAYTPKSRQDFWLKKFSRTVQRDVEVQDELKRLGWQVLVIWECEVKQMDKVEKRLLQFLRCPVGEETTGQNAKK
jgi:DNA mismatch endonuclease (patch repair protein)